MFEIRNLETISIVRLSTRSTFYSSCHREVQVIITVKYHSLALSLHWKRPLTDVDEEKTVPFRYFDFHLQTWPIIFIYLI